MFIQTESTPNPESLKYIPGCIVLDEKFGTGMVRAAPSKGCERVASDPFTFPVHTFRPCYSTFVQVMPSYDERRWRRSSSRSRE